MREILKNLQTCFKAIPTVNYILLLVAYMLELGFLFMSLVGHCPFLPAHLLPRNLSMLQANVPQILAGAAALTF